MFNLQKDALSVFLSTIVEEASSVVRHQSRNCKRRGIRGTKCCLSSKLKLQKKRHQVWFIVEAATVKKKIFHVWFIIRDTTLKEDDPHMIRHQSRNCRRRCTKCGSSLKLQLRKKMHQVWFVIKV
ncbi:hypothetical protein H5410_002138 [Solanum commersonii]|uniref:Uncharacterized protein n=1 Tax=Solanum commersonii TaxID=4109 RepID=A0A9J6B0U6_SOLCO|nr:hypothetical protein H5410_002138 [Solanum commersonii]